MLSPCAPFSTPTALAASEEILICVNRSSTTFSTLPLSAGVCSKETVTFDVDNVTLKSSPPEVSTARDVNASDVATAAISCELDKGKSILVSRSEERRVGKECRCRKSTNHQKKKTGYKKT